MLYGMSMDIEWLNKIFTKKSKILCFLSAVAIFDLLISIKIPLLI